MTTHKVREPDSYRKHRYEFSYYEVRAALYDALKAERRGVVPEGKVSLQGMGVSEDDVLTFVIDEEVT